jgi:methionine synthase II (cobalamin-independent)
LTEVASGHTGVLKLQVAGPWTLAAAVELTRGDKVLADHGATRDLLASLVDGVAAHVADVARRLPGATLLLQVDEPSLPRVLSGRVPTASGFGALAAVAAAEAVASLKAFVAAAGVPVVAHCCADDPPLELFGRVGVAAVSFDATRLRPAADDTVGELVERGVGLFLGLVPSSGPGAPPSTKEVLEPARAMWRRLGFPPERLGAQVVVTPTCGLAGASYGWARTALRLVRQAATALVEAPEGVRG